MTRTLFRFFILIPTILLISCSAQKDYIVESDYSFSARFKKYKTFQFMKMKETDSTALKELLEKTIGSKLHSQGYRYSDRKPDLYVGYKIFEHDFKMTGYDQPQLEEYVYEDWPDRLLTEDDSYISPPPLDHPDTDYHTSRLDMKEGTLLITFYDRKKDKTIWSGYASGIFVKKNTNLRRSLNSATASIFREFRLIADGYVLN